MEPGTYLLRRAIPNPWSAADSRHDWRRGESIPAGTYIVGHERVPGTPDVMPFVVRVVGNRESRFSVPRFHLLWPLLAEHLELDQPSGNAGTKNCTGWS